jgi:hypothetical protein
LEDCITDSVAVYFNLERAGTLLLKWIIYRYTNGEQNNIREGYSRIYPVSYCVCHLQAMNGPYRKPLIDTNYSFEPHAIWEQVKAAGLDMVQDEDYARVARPTQTTVTDMINLVPEEIPELAPDSEFSRAIDPESAKRYFFLSYNLSETLTFGNELKDKELYAAIVHNRAGAEFKKVEETTTKHRKKIQKEGQSFNINIGDTIAELRRSSRSNRGQDSRIKFDSTQSPLKTNRTVAKVKTRRTIK